MLTMTLEQENALLRQALSDRYQGYQTLYFSTGAVDVGFVKPYWFLDVVSKD
jgi:hypothetical protein